MTLRDALQSLYERHGELTPALVVREARAGRTIAGKLLAGHIEWDDSKAAEEYRLEQARHMIRSVRVVYREADDTGDERSVRSFHAVRREGGTVYEPLEKVTADEFTRRLVMADMEREWRALQRRWEHFREFAEMVSRDIKAAA